MKSYLLKMTSVLSVAAFMAVTLFTTPAQAEIVNVNDVFVEATSFDINTLKEHDTTLVCFQCWIWRCSDEKF